MRQYTTEQQTAKLIELGFEKPKNFIEGATFADSKSAYSIGELIEILPEFVNWTPRVIRGNIIEYSFETEGSELYYCNANNELIDNLFDMAIKLKEDGYLCFNKK